MISERIYLGEDKVAYLDTYVVADGRIAPREAMLVIPGGGYANVCIDREGESIALAFLARGINAFVLNYHVGVTNNYPTHLLDAARAMVHIRENAEKYHINPERIFAVGFSAGGHLCATLATKHKVAEELLGLEKDYARPHAVVLSYPVITAMHPTHKGTYYNLVGKPFEEIPEDVRALHSHELHIDGDTPPAFIWHTATDIAVPPIGSLRLAEAYIDAGVPVELHLYPRGSHGIALAVEHTSAGNQCHIDGKTAGWVDDAIEFLKSV